MKKIGIVADDYKVKTFKKLLRDNGFEFKTQPFTRYTTLIKIKSTEDRIPDIERLCKQANIDTTRAN